jgi:hypothetical protein
VSTWRLPFGTYTRNTPDFFVESACVAACAFQNPALNGDDVTIDLFNNADQGQYLYVYDLWVFNDAQGMWAAGLIQGHGANLVTNAFSVIANRAAPFGQVYQDLTANFSAADQVIPQTPTGSYIFGGTDSESFSNPQSKGPIAVLAPGTSFRVRSFISSFFQDHGIAVTFFYVVLPDQG